MKYFKVKKVVDEYTTKSIVVKDNEPSYCYEQIDEYQYYGVDTTDANFLARQHPECEVTELTFAEMEPVLKNCKMHADINAMVTAKIRKTFSRDKEFKLTNLGVGDKANTEYKSYRQYIKTCCDEGSEMKKEHGLKV